MTRAGCSARWGPVTGDGDEALRLVGELGPDLITLDLEMPRMDGFKFLRLLMARRPTPVIVVSGYAEKDNVFRALELGAIDFIAKPSRTLASSRFASTDFPSTASARARSRRAESSGP